MGLRIVDRRTKARADITEAEHALGLEGVASDWLAARGGVRTKNDATAFLTHFRQVKSRITSPDSVLEMAHRIRASLKNRAQDGMAPHDKVDIATLLELL